MAAEEGAEPSVPVAEDGGGPSASTSAPSQPPSAPAASVQVPNTADMAKAAAAARALQIRAEILSTSQLVVPQAAPSQPTAAPTALAAVQAQVSPDPETQAEADMEAMRQNMTWLQDMLRQMQKQQQAYEAARRTKLNQSLPKHTINHLAKRHKQWRKGLRLCRRNSKLSFSNSSNPTAFQVQPHRPTRRGIQVKPGLGVSPWNQGPQFDFVNAAQAPTVRQQAPTLGFGTNQAPIQAAMTWSQPIFDPSMAAQQVPPVGAGQPNAMAQPHAQAAISPFATPYVTSKNDPKIYPLKLCLE
uniref:Retroelement n=2 Tax=Oryza sativa subsp. japonica TaxID=39947 RepID=Q8S6Y6_ORYSJ|nr:Putative retroelement [Oryza sativa Japonica Group]AAP52777.1 hypothetical protein LOC_Os10g14840 [Oryza sativa Japonica Group]